MGLVGALGTASTGTAIASLSGAAATTAQLYWLGGLVGGGVFAGTVLTGGLGLLAGLAAVRFWNGRPREYENLLDVEKNIFLAASLFLKATTEEIESKTADKNELVAYSRQLSTLCKTIESYRFEKDNEAGFTFSETLAPKHMWNLFAAVERLENKAEKLRE